MGRRRGPGAPAPGSRCSRPARRRTRACPRRPRNVRAHGEDSSMPKFPTEADFPPLDRRRYFVTLDSKKHCGVCWRSALPQVENFGGIGVGRSYCREEMLLHGCVECGDTFAYRAKVVDADPPNSQYYTPALLGMPQLRDINCSIGCRHFRVAPRRQARECAQSYSTLSRSRRGRPGGSTRLTPAAVARPALRPVRCVACRWVYVLQLSTFDIEQVGNPAPVSAIVTNYIYTIIIVRQ